MKYQLEKTVDIFERTPKLISPGIHRWIDIAAASSFAIIRGFLLGRGNGRAATAAFINGGTAATVSLLTDYDGDGIKPISFRMHGFLDLVLAATVTGEPLIFGFPSDKEAGFFYSGGPGVVAVVAMTDWNAADRQSSAYRTRCVTLHRQGGRDVALWNRWFSGALSFV